MPRVRLVSRWTTAGARTKVAFFLIFFQILSRDCSSRLKCSSVSSSPTVRTITPPESSGRMLDTICRSRARSSRDSIFRLTPTRLAEGM
jgi:hypothetical protein